MQAHLCACPGCGKDIASHLLMCYRHWGQVPRGIQRTVNRRWRAYGASTTDKAADCWLAYMVARKAAIDSLPATSRQPTTGAPT